MDVDVGSNSLAIWERTWRFVWEISVAKSGGTRKNSSDVAFLEEVGCQKMIALDMS